MTMTAYPSYCAVLLAVTVLTSCASAPTRFYTVEASPPAHAAAKAVNGPAIRVDAVHIPPALDRIELTRNGRDGQVVVSDNNHWVAPVDELIRRALTEDLIARLPAGAVVFPDSPKPPATQGVVIDILGISNQRGALVMEASWSLIPAPQAHSNSQAAPPQPHTLTLSAVTANSGVAGQAAGISLLIGELADHIATDLTAATPQF